MKKGKAWKDADLQRQLDDLNETFFEGRLRARARFADLTGERCTGALVQQGEIRVERALSRFYNEVRVVLLHEAVHQRLCQDGHRGEEHGLRFHMELQRLWDLGAYEGLL